MRILDRRPAQELLERPVKPEPRQPLFRLISAGDYPQAALQNRREGTTAVVLTINSEGRVDGCFIDASSGSTDLDTATCRLLSSRARFEPARDARDQRVASAVATRVRWQLPRLLTIPVVPWASTVTFDVVNGRVVRCTEQHSAAAPLAINNCQVPAARVSVVAIARNAAPDATTTVHSFMRMTTHAEWTEGAPPPGTPLAHHVADLQIDEQGELKDCTLRVVVQPKQVRGDPATCRLFLASRYTVARSVADNRPKPATAKVELMIVRER